MSEPVDHGSQSLRLQADGGVLTAVVSNGAQNLFTPSMVTALRKAVEGAGASGFWAVRIRAHGEAFCLGRERRGQTEAEIRAEVREVVSLNRALRDCGAIVIAEVQGDAAGFGAGLVAGSDVAVASDGARFWFPEVHAGLAPAIVISWLGGLLPRKQVFRLTSTGERLSAPEALECGLVSEVVPAADLGRRVDEVIAHLDSVPNEVLSEIKRFSVAASSVNLAALEDQAVESLVSGTTRAQARPSSAAAFDHPGSLDA